MQPSLTFQIPKGAIALQDKYWKAKSALLEVYVPYKQTVNFRNPQLAQIQIFYRVWKALVVYKEQTSLFCSQWKMVSVCNESDSWFSKVKFILHAKTTTIKEYKRQLLCTCTLEICDIGIFMLILHQYNIWKKNDILIFFLCFSRLIGWVGGWYFTMWSE